MSESVQNSWGRIPKNVQLCVILVLQVAIFILHRNYIVSVDSASIDPDTVTNILLWKTLWYFIVNTAVDLILIVAMFFTLIRYLVVTAYIE